MPGGGGVPWFFSLCFNGSLVMVKFVFGGQQAQGF